MTLPSTWLGLLAPAGTPKPIIDKLNAAMLATLQRPDVIAKLKQQGATPVGGTPEDMGERMKAELAHWGRVIPSIGITPE